MLDPVRDLSQCRGLVVVVVIAAAIGWASGGWRLGHACAVPASWASAALRVWDLAMDTLSQVLVAVVISVCVAMPIGIWAGRVRPGRDDASGRSSTSPR